MVNRLHTILLLFTLIFAHPAQAQKEMYISPIFSGVYNSNPNAEVIILKGKKLKPYGLKLFYSISIHKSPDHVQLFEERVLKDGESAVETQLVKKGDEVVACYYQFAPHPSDKDKLNRFILFRKENNQTATLIYLEGKTELDKLIRIFINKKESLKNE